MVANDKCTSLERFFVNLEDKLNTIRLQLCLIIQYLATAYLNYLISYLILYHHISYLISSHLFSFHLVSYLITNLFSYLNSYLILYLLSYLISCYLTLISYLSLISSYILSHLLTYPKLIVHFMWENINTIYSEWAQALHANIRLGRLQIRNNYWRKKCYSTSRGSKKTENR